MVFVIGVGSTNPVKIKAVEEITSEYSLLQGAKVRGLDLQLALTDQPLSIRETIDGAVSRARAAAEQSEFGVGLEGGIFARKLEGRECAFQICAAAIACAEGLSLGFSPAFPLPDTIRPLVFLEGQNLSDALKGAGLTQKQNVGWEEGAVGIFTSGRIDRVEYSKLALRMAMVQLENSSLYL